MSELQELREELAALREQVRRLEQRTEARAEIRGVLAEYMRLCDLLDHSVDMADIGALFTTEAVWEGRGGRNAKAFGAHQGRQAIVDFLDAYRVPEPHFLLNVHYLTSEVIEVEDCGTRACGSWVMLQLSTVRSGASTLVGARLNIRFTVEDGAWRMSRFTTTNLFSRPVETPWDQSLAIPVPDAHS